MKHVIVYVEGPSDRVAMGSLLAPLVAQKSTEGIRINFVQAPEGDRKLSLIEKVPARAVNTLQNDPNALVVVMPDLYPRDKGFPHSTVAELQAGIVTRFRAALAQRRLTDDGRLIQRFRVFCFKHDLEALLLAAHDALALFLDVDRLPITWTVPVEEQNHNHPPKRVIENLFRAYGQSYVGTEDTREILSLADYRAIAAACPEGFGALVRFLEQTTP